MAKKISVIIPNYNGMNLLENNLPIVLKTCQDCEIIVVDDGSKDDSVNLIRRKFKQIKLVVHETNKGFVRAVNSGVNNSSGDLILLLNSDVAPRKDFLNSLIKYFGDQKVFAVGIADQSHEEGKIVVRGRGTAEFKRGLIKHWAASIKRGETFWVSAGSGLFDKKKYQELGGLDPIFAPFYWEDIDLSYRAQKRGYKCLFEPASKVDHYHEEGAIKKNKSKFLIRSASYKNQFIFFWKNISDYTMIIKHILWLPYHFVKALVTLDAAFVTGLIWALTKIPSLIFSTQLSTMNYQLTDREIFYKFEKS